VNPRDPAFDPAALLLADSEREAIARALDSGSPVRIETPPGASVALLLRALRGLRPGPWVCVTEGPRALERLEREVRAFAPGPGPDDLRVYPAREESLVSGGQARSLEAGRRLDVLRQCAAGGAAPFVLTCIQALLQTTAMRAIPGLRLEAGTASDPLRLAESLQAQGYLPVLEVQSPGELAHRGGLLDVWPPGDEFPVRIEFLGEAVDSLRRFDPDNQRSRGRIASAEIGPAAEPSGDGALLADHLPPGTTWLWIEPERIGEHAELFERTVPEDEAARATDFATLRHRIEVRKPGPEVSLASPEEGGPGGLQLDLQPVEALPALSDLTGGPDALEGLRREQAERWLARAEAGAPVLAFFSTEGARERFLEQYAPDGAPADFATRPGWLSGGFTAGGGRLTVVAECDLYGARREPRGDLRRRARTETPSALQGPADWSRMQPGDLVVHVEHGIGRYGGIVEIESGGLTQEVLSVEYAGQTRLYVPVAQAHLLSRYVGIGGRPPELHSLGGARWTRERSEAERAVRDLAASLLETQALRQTRPGHAFRPDPPWFHEFESGFPFEETPDQRRAIRDVLRDMENPRPMDRLICGDVGYGKTEVAMRAAFKAVLDGKQVALLVPTTVLAQQHYQTFCERMADFPVSIGLLSRFVSRADQRDALGRLRDGRLDIVIGTHRLVQSDVVFKDLGLAILDEEQRFGVEQKEALKRLRRTVDVLTLTATPIPRTLYLGLLGARDLSVIETPPRERLPVETSVHPWDARVVREAILRELAREGQAFYLHNRVATIDSARDLLTQLVPEARIGVAHGQMPEGELERIMVRFVRRELDVLLCTTIIESGVDIPNVNTILIDRADRFGLSDLYQLRGRVGRYKHKAYAILLLPRHGRLFDTARKRISALRRHASLGAGFRLALRDLELRGAGNLLGARQSGHVSAVGFDLYCRLLRESVARLRGEAAPPAAPAVRVTLDFLALSPEGADGPSAAIPHRYVEDEDLRLELYRRIGALSAGVEADALAEECADRFGRRPPELDRLLDIARIRIRAHAKGIESVETREDRLVLMVRDFPWKPGGLYPRLRETEPGLRLREILDRIGEAPALRR
jgi:transcription-repair coupling factor (superfamily II helicase)